MAVRDSLSLFGDVLASIARSSEAVPAPQNLSLDTSATTESLDRQLLDLRLPKSLNWLAAPLQTLGLTFEPVEVTGRFRSPARFYHVISNGAERCVMFHVPKGVLDEDGSWDAFGTVFDAIQLPPGQVLLIVSEGLDALQVAYSVMAQPYWLDRRQISATFVPWRHLQEIKAQSETEQQVFLPKLLRLEALLAKAQASASVLTVITDEVLLKIANILERVTLFTDASKKGWRTTFQIAGLESIYSEFEFDGSAKDVSFRVLTRLKIRVPLNSQPTRPVLGMFLSGVLTLEIPQADADYIREVLTTYRLAPQEVG